MRSGLVVLAVAVGLCGCIHFPNAALVQGPMSVEQVTGPVVCGPVGFRKVPLQSRWGEYVRVTVTAPSRIEGQVLVHAGGVAQEARTWVADGAGALVVEAKFPNEDPDRRFALERERPIDITLTGLAATAGGTCEGAVFTVEHGALVPDIDERAWLAELVRRGGPELAARREAARVEGEARREAHYAAWAARHVEVSAELLAQADLVRQQHYAAWDARHTNTNTNTTTAAASLSPEGERVGVRGDATATALAAPAMCVPITASAAASTSSVSSVAVATSSAASAPSSCGVGFMLATSDVAMPNAPKSVGGALATDAPTTGCATCTAVAVTGASSVGSTTSVAPPTVAAATVGCASCTAGVAVHTTVATELSTTAGVATSTTADVSTHATVEVPTELHAEASLSVHEVAPSVTVSSATEWSQPFDGSQAWSQPSDAQLRGGASLEGAWVQPFEPRLQTVAVSTESQVATATAPVAQVQVEAPPQPVVVEPAVGVLVPALFQLMFSVGTVSPQPAPQPVHGAAPVR